MITHSDHFGGNTMRQHPHIYSAFKNELYDAHLWRGRALFIAFAALAGLTVVSFTWLTEHALDLFFKVQAGHWWAPLIWTPLTAAAIVWVTRRYFPGAAGSGIPQVMAAQDPAVTQATRGLFVSLRLTLAKMVLTAWGLLGGVVPGA